MIGLAGASNHQHHPFTPSTMMSFHLPLPTSADLSFRICRPTHILDLHFRDICFYILYYVCFTCTRLVDYRLRFDQEVEEMNILPLNFNGELLKTVLPPPPPPTCQLLYSLPSGDRMIGLTGASISPEAFHHESPKFHSAHRDILQLEY